MRSYRLECLAEEEWEHVRIVSEVELWTVYDWLWVAPMDCPHRLLEGNRIIFTAWS